MCAELDSRLVNNLSRALISRINCRLFKPMRNEIVATTYNNRVLMNPINWPAYSIWVFIAQAGRALQR